MKLLKCLHELERLWRAGRGELSVPQTKRRIQVPGCTQDLVSSCLVPNTNSAFLVLNPYLD
jgi:hypothetical protein